MMPYASYQITVIRNQQVACSSHVSSSKKKDTLLACLSFWVSAAEGRLHPSVFQCSGRQSHPCSKVFASGENTCTPQKRRGPEGPLGKISRWRIENLKYLDCSALPKRKTSAESRCLSFWVGELYYQVQHFRKIKRVHTAPCGRME